MGQVQEDTSSAYGKVEPALGSIDSDQKIHADALCRSMGLRLSASVNEHLLFHGTDDKGKVCSITASGFEPWASKNAMYGKGTYFASEACKSHQYTCPANCLRACSCP